MKPDREFFTETLCSKTESFDLISPLKDGVPTFRIIFNNYPAYSDRSSEALQRFLD